MTNEQIVMTWKDEDYRLSLSEAERALLPENPAGLVELTDEQLMAVDGGTTSPYCAVITIISVIASAYQSCVLCN